MLTLRRVSQRDEGNAASVWQWGDVDPAVSGSEDLGLSFPTAPSQGGKRFLEGRTLVTVAGTGR